MCQYDDPDQGVGTVELNVDLQQAHLELLSAHRATQELRLRYGLGDIVRFGRHETLRKSVQAASELSEFYSALGKKIPQPAPVAATVAAQPTPQQIAQAVGWLSGYLREQSEYYAPIATTLPPDVRARVQPYFSPQLLGDVRFIELRGARVSVPAFFAQARALGFELPEVTHMDSLTFVDVIVFNRELTERALFHALVHAVQIRALGLERYAELWVQAFIRTRVHFTVPLEVHAFSLSSRFLRPFDRFSVEADVLDWINDGRY
jgi:hypothetical protein